MNCTIVMLPLLSKLNVSQWLQYHNAPFESLDFLSPPVNRHLLNGLQKGWNCNDSRILELLDRFAKHTRHDSQYLTAHSNQLCSQTSRSGTSSGGLSGSNVVKAIFTCPTVISPVSSSSWSQSASSIDSM